MIVLVVRYCYILMVVIVCYCVLIDNDWCLLWRIGALVCIGVCMRVLVCVVVNSWVLIYVDDCYCV